MTLTNNLKRYCGVKVSWEINASTVFDFISAVATLAVFIRLFTIRQENRKLKAETTDKYSEAVTRILASYDKLNHTLGESSDVFVAQIQYLNNKVEELRAANEVLESLNKDLIQKLDNLELELANVHLMLGGPEGGKK